MRSKPLTLEQFRWIAIGVAMLLMTICGCGTRKVSSEIQKNSQVVQSDKYGASSKDSESADKSESKSSQLNDKTEESTETTTTTKFNDSGKAVETTTTTKTGKVVDKTKYRNILVRELKTRTIEKVKFRDITRNVITTVYKTKEVDKDSTWVKNLGGKWVVFGLGAFAVTLIVGAVFLYFYLRKQ